MNSRQKPGVSPLQEPGFWGRCGECGLNGVQQACAPCKSVCVCLFGCVHRVAVIGRCTVEEQVECHGGDAPAECPIRSAGGCCAASTVSVGRTSGTMPMPMDTATMNRLLRLLVVHCCQYADARGCHHAEHHQTGTTQHKGGQRLDQRRHFGQQAQHHQNHATGHTHKAATPLTPTRPTFCEKLVYGRC